MTIFLFLRRGQTKIPGMRFWLSHRSEVPIRDQLVTQIMLGILSGDLRAGARLPSTRELARRFKVHANTVSAAYRELERERWVEFRHGSGVYIRRQKEAQLPSRLELDRLIAGLFRTARELGAPLAEVQARLRQWLTIQPPDHFLVIEPDADLRAIAVAEIQKVVSFRVEGRGLDACRSPRALAYAVPVVFPSKAELVQRQLPAGCDCLPLRVNSIPTSLAAWLPKAKRDSLVAVASRWQGFLISARTMLVAAGLDPEALLLRDARKCGWD